jgi:hypothetical protein
LMTFMVENKVIIYSIIALLLIILIAVYIRTNRKD